MCDYPDIIRDVQKIFGTLAATQSKIVTTIVDSTTHETVVQL